MPADIYSYNEENPKLLFNFTEAVVLVTIALITNRKNRKQEKQEP